MVAGRSTTLRSNQSIPLFIYITGCDGTGKTTQSYLLIDHLQARGIKTSHLWLRFPFFFNLPLLAYARWRGYSWYEETESVRHGYWDFRDSWTMNNIFPWTLFLDAIIASIWKVYFPLLLGKTIVCERFVLDMLVDLSVATGYKDIHKRLPGRLYTYLLPKDTSIIILDLDVEIIQARRSDLRVDHRLEDRLESYRQISEDLHLPIFSSSLPILELNRAIWNEIEADNENRK